MVTALFTILRKLSECARVFAPPFEMAPRLKSNARTHRNSKALPATAGRQREISNLCPAANRFERAVFRWLLSH